MTKFKPCQFIMKDLQNGENYRFGSIYICSEFVQGHFKYTLTAMTVRNKLSGVGKSNIYKKRFQFIRCDVQSAI